MATSDVLLHGDKNLKDQGGQDEEPEIGLEDVQKELACLGRYQVSQLLFHSWCYTPFVFVLLGFVFIGYVPEHTCLAVNETQLLEKYNLLNDPTATVSYGTCTITVTSNTSGQDGKVASVGCYGGYNYHGGKYVSMVTEWDLVCDNSGKVELVQSMLSLGNAIGMAVWTSVADRFGRKYTYIFTMIAAMASELGLYLSQSIYAAIVFRFFSGAFAGGMVLIRYVLAHELFISKYRHAQGAFDSFWWSLNVTILAGCAFALRHNEWRHFQLLTLLLFVPPFILSFLVNDTPAWYFAKGRYEDAKRILTKASLMNKKNLSKVQNLYSKCVKYKKFSKYQTITEGANYSLLDILRHRRLLRTSAILCFGWMTVSFGYYGLILTSSTLAGNRYLNFFLLAVMDFPGYFLNAAILFYAGRRTVAIVFYALSAIALMVSACLVGPASNTSYAASASTVFFLFGKFSITVSFNVLFVYTPELHPTTLRSSVVGMCDFCAQLINVLAPFLLVLFQIAPWAPGTIIASACAICVISFFLLPETKGRQLPSTIEEILNWGRVKSRGKT